MSLSILNLYWQPIQIHKLVEFHDQQSSKIQCLGSTLTYVFSKTYFYGNTKNNFILKFVYCKSFWKLYFILNYVVILFIYSIIYSHRRRKDFYRVIGKCVGELIPKH